MQQSGPGPVTRRTQEGAVASIVTSLCLVYLVAARQVIANGDRCAYSPDLSAKDGWGSGEEKFLTSSSIRLSEMMDVAAHRNSTIHSHQLKTGAFLHEHSKSPPSSRVV